MRLFITLIFISISIYSGFSQVVPRPQNVQASDDKDKMINITWDAQVGCKSYLYWSESKDTNKMQFLIWSENNRYSHQQLHKLKVGKRYYYAAKSQRGGRLSTFSNVDEGHLNVVADDGDLQTKTLSEADCLPLSIEDVDSSNAGFIDLTYSISNTCEKNFPIQIVYFYYSKDATFNDRATLLVEKKTNPFSIDMDKSQRGAVRLELPLGTWYVFILRGGIKKPLIRKIIMGKKD